MPIKKIIITSRRKLSQYFFGFLILVFLLACLTLPFSFSKADSSADAIAIRVIPNPNHYSALRWYKERGFAGSPQSLSVDGYEAVRDGRTVYVNVANVSTGNSNSFFTNIYLISYNLEAEQATEDIFGQILNNWKFNANIADSGNCSQSQDKGCLIDNECPATEYCLSLKARITRDTRRLSDIADIKSYLENYKSAHNSYPALASGTYLSGKTISTWPSWEKTFGPALNAALPQDPINKLGTCPSSYNSITCWNDNNQSFADPSDDNSFNLPDNSYAYVYSASSAGNSFNFCANMESGFIDQNTGNCVGNIIANSPPEIISSSLPLGKEGREYKAYIAVNNPDGDALTWNITLENINWANAGWSAPPVLKNTELLNQKMIWAATAGNTGDYNISVSISDNRGGTDRKNFTLKTVGCLDQDEDSFSPEGGNCGQIDCNDANSSIKPGATEICGNNIDEDCSGADLACSGNCTPDGCNSICPTGCTVAEDPDCGCRTGNNCCGLNCTHANDNECSASCAENWNCTVWSSCSSGSQTRTCTDSNSCGTTNNKPAESQSCSPLSVAINSPTTGTIFMQNESISFSGQASGGTGGPYTYSWISDKITSGPISGLQAFSLSNLPIGNHIITLRATDTNNSAATNDITIHILPLAFDWSHKILPNALPAGGNDWMTPVKNQNNCGSCWAFATLAVVEGQYSIQINNYLSSPDLSEQFLIYCTAPAGSCLGDPNFALPYLKNSGVPNKSCIPYTGQDSLTSTCPTQCANNQPINSLWKIDNFFDVDTNNSLTPADRRKQMKRLLVNHGPLLNGLHMGTSWNFTTYQCSNSTNSHYVAVVGYDDALETWIAKNSWGSSWGTNGYFRIAYGKCAIENNVKWINQVTQITAP
jgi:hypothetical protein